jgi:hypothetical protein
MLCQELSPKRPAEPVFCLVQRATCNANKSAIFLICATAVAFGDVGTDAIRRSHELFSDRVAGEVVPKDCHIPNRIGDFFRETIYPQVLKVRASHDRFIQLTTDD